MEHIVLCACNLFDLMTCYPYQTRRRASARTILDRLPPDARPLPFGGLTMCMIAMYPANCQLRLQCGPSPFPSTYCVDAPPHAYAKRWPACSRHQPPCTP
eukprot:scaffold15406_cov119-Isochrysis_galbana.AAC.9